MPNCAVINLSLVITSLTFCFTFFSKRKSRLVKIPTNLCLASTIGIPPIRCSRIMRNASPTVASGLSVTGSTIKPLSVRFTFRTCSACFSILMFLCKIPIPPSRAKAIAKVDSVTVSIAADTNGILMDSLRVSWEEMVTSRGNTSEYEGTNNTSSKVKPSLTILEFVAMRKGKRIL